MLRTNATSGSHGLCLEEFAPFGVIGVITPVTHSDPHLTANAINMIAAGNAIVCNPHPGGAHCAAHAVRAYNKAIADQLRHRAPDHGRRPADAARPPRPSSTIRGVPLLVVTGGPAVAGAALAARKRAIVAGPGNPPVVVDETA